MKIRIICLIGLLFFISSKIEAQEAWYHQMQNGTNFYDVKDAFEAYRNDPNSPKRGSWKQFERWAHRMEERAYPTGTLENAGSYLKMRQQATTKSQSLKTASYPTWNSLGPDVVPFGGGTGRLNFIAFHPDSDNVFFVGAPAGGLWKTKDNGQVFEILNDDLPVIGCSDLAIDPNNPNIMYLGTGDRDASDTYSIGILKTIDGGLTWDTTGLAWPISDMHTVSRIRINPFNTDMIIAATSDGIQKSIDGGQTWSKKKAGLFKDIEFKPGDSSTLYVVAGSSYYYSTNAADTFIYALTPFASPVSRMEIEVTPADPSVVYILAGRQIDGGLNGLLRSNDSGRTFSQVHGNSPNLLGWSSDGSDNGGQSFYDLAMAVSPYDEDRVTVGGINTWESSNGGSSFTLRSHWTGAGASYAHADCHDLAYKPNTDTLYAANDGGIFVSRVNENQWYDLTNTLQITQSYRLGISQITNQTVLAGNQDNGTIQRLSNGSFSQIGGGDGFECIFDHTANSVRYYSIYYGFITRNSNGAISAIAGQGINGITESGDWETPYVMDPYQNNVLYAGYENIWRTLNSGQSWSKRNNNSFPAAGKVNQLVIAPWDIDVLAASKNDRLYYSIDAGSNWTRIDGGIPNQFITGVHFSPIYQAQGFTMFVTLSGYNGGEKVYKTSDGGLTWQNISAGIPNVPANCVIQDPNSTGEAIYIGTDIGVFYKDNSMPEFELYSNGLPNTIVEEMEIHQASGTIIACTYGRGIWEVDLYSKITSIKNPTFAKRGNFEVGLYPNPVNDNLHLAFESDSNEPIMVKLISIQGKEVYATSLNPVSSNTALQIDLKEAKIPEGLFLVKVSQGDKQIVKKILKN